MFSMVDNKQTSCYRINPFMDSRIFILTLVLASAVFSPQIVRGDDEHSADEVEEQASFGYREPTPNAFGFTKDGLAMVQAEREQYALNLAATANMLLKENALSDAGELLVDSKLAEPMLPLVDRLMGLEFGADDYVCKPFLPREVVARVKAILRRVQMPAAALEADTSRLSYRSITLQPERYLCLIADERVELTPVEFRLLQTMIAQPGRVFSRENLMRASYPDRRVVSDRTVDSHVKNLRKKVNAVVGDEDLIHSIYGVGYKLE